MLPITMVTFYQLPWLHVTNYRGYLLTITMVTCYQLHVTNYPGYMLLWLHCYMLHDNIVSYYIIRVTVVTRDMLLW